MKYDRTQLATETATYTFVFWGNVSEENVIVGVKAGAGKEVGFPTGEVCGPK